MKCEKCGAYYDTGNFCMRCGGKLVASQAEEGGSSQSPRIKGNLKMGDINQQVPKNTAQAIKGNADNNIISTLKTEVDKPKHFLPLLLCVSVVIVVGGVVLFNNLRGTADNTKVKTYTYVQAASNAESSRPATTTSMEAPATTEEDGVEPAFSQLKPTSESKPQTVDDKGAVQTTPQAVIEAVTTIAPAAEPDYLAVFEDGRHNLVLYAKDCQRASEGTYARVGLEELVSVTDEYINNLRIGGKVNGLEIRKIDRFAYDDTEEIFVNDGEWIAQKTTGNSEWNLIAPNGGFYTEIVDWIDVFFPVDAKYYDNNSSVVIDGEFREIPLSRIENYFDNGLNEDHATVTVTVENGKIVEGHVYYTP